MRLTASILAILVIFTSANAFAQSRKVNTAVELNITARDGKDAHQVNVYTTLGWKDRKIGFSAFELITEGWGQVYFGPTYSVAEWLSVSGSLGIETDRPSFRKAGSVWVGKNGSYFLSIQEKGSDHWQKNVASIRVAKALNVGVFQQTYVGLGPYVEVNVGNVRLWGSVAPKDHRGILAVKASF